VIQVLINFVGGYLLGSVPFAYLITRAAARIDIRGVGSGNVGGYNTYVVTKSKGMALIVILLDMAKGFAAVWASSWLFPNLYLLHCIALIGAVGGHNYSIWLGFKGGRGLATSAGGAILLGLSYAMVWSLVWLIAKMLKRDILTSNIIAILLTPVVLWALPWTLVERLSVGYLESASFLFLSCVMSIVLLISHFDAIRDIWAGRNPDDSKASTPIP
jgi:glycerol-3-phosphate acyltransferase PlsY